MSLKSILIIILILIIPFVYSASYCYKEACADQSLPGSNGFTGFASNQNNIFPNLTYSSCDISKSNYTSLLADINNDGTSEVITEWNNYFDIYNLDCFNIAHVLLPNGEIIKSMPQIVNYDSDAYPEIVILTNSSLYFYEYDTTQNVSIQKNITYAYTSAQGNLIMGLSCSADGYIIPSCLAHNNTGANKIIRFIYSTSSYDVQDSFTVDTGIPVKNYGGYASTRINSGSQSGWIPYCNFGSGTNNLRCDLMFNSGNYTGYTVISGNTGSLLSTLTELDAYIARIGSDNRVLVSARYTNNLGIWIIADLDGTVYNESEAQNISNFVAGDYSKDGGNEICQLMYFHNTTAFRCYDKLGSLKIDINVSGNMNFSEGIIIADFNQSEQKLGVATVEGIYYINSDGTVRNMFHTSYTSSVNRNGMLTVANLLSSGSPYYIYTDSQIGFIIKNAVVSQTCGNGICDNFENAYSCPSDCGSQANGTCYTDSECTNPVFNKCLGNKCVGCYTGIGCNFDTDCPQESAPYCYANYCICGMSSNLSFSSNINANGQIDRNQADIQYFFNKLSNGSTWIKTIAAIMIILIFAITTYAFILLLHNTFQINKTPHMFWPFIGSILGVLLDIMFGLIPIWFVILLILLSIGGWLIFRYIMPVTPEA